MSSGDIIDITVISPCSYRKTIPPGCWKSRSGTAEQPGTHERQARPMSVCFNRRNARGGRNFSLPPRAFLRLSVCFRPVFDIRAIAASASCCHSRINLRMQAFRFFFGRIAVTVKRPVQIHLHERFFQPFCLFVHDRHGKGRLVQLHGKLKATPHEVEVVEKFTKKW